MKPQKKDMFRLLDSRRGRQCPDDCKCKQDDAITTELTAEEME